MKTKMASELRRKIVFCAVVVLVILVSLQAAASGQEDTPVSDEPGQIGSLAAEGAYTNLIETAHDDSAWALVVSDAILRENLCSNWYDKPFNPCYDYNRYWKLPSNEAAGEAFPMDIIGQGTLDGLYVKAGYYFQLYSNTAKPENPDDLIPYGPLMMGPQYVSVDFWQDDAPDGFEPGTFLVEGGEGGLKDYSIIIYTYNPDILTKTSDVADGDCRSPGQEITYTICWDNFSGPTLTDVYIVDQLPAGVDYPVTYDLDTSDPNNWQMISSDPNYNPDTHEYIWPLGSIAPNETGCVNLTVVVNYNAAPGGSLHNVAQLRQTILVCDPNDPNSLYEETRVLATATEDTDVCCWQETLDELFVDQNVDGGANNGLDWPNAFIDLQSALEYARSRICGHVSSICVAQGVYTPDDTENGFVLPDNIFLYGGFPTGGCDFADRNPKKYETILTGLIDEDEFPDATIVVSMGDDSVLDGFSVVSGLEYNIYGNGANFTSSHCIIKDGYGYGIYAEDGNVAVQWCSINSCRTDGLYHEGEDYSLTIDNSWIMRNGEYGVRTIGSTLDLKNSIVSESDMAKKGREGIYIENPTHQPKIFNATIANNKAAGVYFEDDADASGDPNNLDYPDLQNSIVYYNNKGGPQLAGINADLHANFCCIQDCNEPGTTNFHAEPGFAYAVDPNGTPDPNNYHLAYDAFCKDKANPFLSYANQVDIDGEGLDRQYGSAVDIGADEVYDCHDDYLSEADVYNAVDFDADGIVNLNEFRLFSVAWLSHDPNEPGLADPNMAANWNPQCNLDTAAGSAYTIDTADLMVFLDDWLWIACWKLDEINAAMAATQPQMQPQTLPLSLMTESIAVESSLSVAVLEAPAEVPVIESSVIIVEEPNEVEQDKVSAETLTEFIGFLDEILLTETDNIEGIEQIKAILQEELDALSAAQEQ